jgi:hypothetical protein
LIDSFLELNGERIPCVVDDDCALELGWFAHAMDKAREAPKQLAEQTDSPGAPSTLRPDCGQFA